MFLNKLVSPRYPASALELERGIASVAQLEGRRGNVFTLRRAASIVLEQSLIQPSFADQNIENPLELEAALTELATSAGLLRQRNWSVALPEGATRTLILTVESQTGSRSELEEVLNWKLERGFGRPVDELTIARERLPKDAQGRERYLAVGIHNAVLAQYEGVLRSLGWNAGLILPRHSGEALWLTRNGNAGDALLLTAHREGFTAAILRDKKPLIIRSVLCAADEREDEFYRLLLFYRDRLADSEDSNENPSCQLTRLLVLGEGFDKQRAAAIAGETLGGQLRSLGARDVGLQIPSHQLSFDTIAAAAGLATLRWE